mgnify:CR=1 FL=1
MSDKRRTVLVIEDTPDNLELIKVLLEDAGLHTLEATTGREGIEIAIAQRPHLILLDIQLPDISGYEVLRAIRNSPTNGDIPIIAITSYAMSGDREKLLGAGCNGYIEKPIDTDNVVNIILNHIRE